MVDVYFYKRSAVAENNRPQLVRQSRAFFAYLFR